jgi:hypothetical protein
MTYRVFKRDLPSSLQRRQEILGLRIGPKQGYKRPWVLAKDGLPIGYYETAEEAIDAAPEPPEEAMT